jgi:Protein of unknown function (DUF2637)
MCHQTMAWPTGLTTGPDHPSPEATDAIALPRWLTYGLFGLASLVLLALACASAWLSYHAQVDYVFDHNGEQATAARVWALLLDCGTAGLSLLRLYEALCGTPCAGTRTSLLACVAASIAMNLLHTPASAQTPGGYMVAAVPPLMYAVFLERFLANLRSMLIGPAERREKSRTMTLWANFPRAMWRERRAFLRRIAENHSSALHTDGSGPEQCRLQQEHEGAEKNDCQRPPLHPRRSRGPGTKRIAFEAALADQVRCGDLRLFSEDERERNHAAYQAAASLPAPLSSGTARKYVVQALPRMKAIAAAQSDPTSN